MNARSRRAAILGLVIAACASLGVVARRSRAQSEPRAATMNGARTPVLVELFTSEGCSSCPPAERMLGRMASQQSVPGAEIVLLSFHVDYWDYLGWRDGMASPDATLRQQSYARALHRNVYTPQAIVDGQSDFVGSDEGNAISSIEAAAHAPKVPITITQAPGSDLVALDLHVGGNARAQSSDLVVAIVEDKLTVDVRAGENAGSKLEHPAVVRWFRHLGPAAHVEVAPEANWRRDHLRAIAFMSDSNRAVIGVGTLVLNAR